MSNKLTTIYRTSDETGELIKSHDRLVRLDEHKKPFVIMNGKRAYLKKMYKQAAMEVIRFAEDVCCEVCGRILTAESSRESGIGPVCSHS
jgi:hypothetical protein